MEDGFKEGKEEAHGGVGWCNRERELAVVYAMERHDGLTVDVREKKMRWRLCYRVKEM